MPNTARKSRSLAGRWSRLGALAYVLASCATEDAGAARCKRGVNHIMTLVSTVGGSTPSAEEQVVIDGVAKRSLDVCTGEGLTQAQLDCVLAVSSADQLAQLAACPAIAAKRPSWLILPSRAP